MKRLKSAELKSLAWTCVLATSLFSLLSLTACKNLREKVDPPELQTGEARPAVPELNLNLSILVDNSLSDTEQKLLSEDFKFLQQIRFKPSPGSYFDKAFGRGSETSVIKFIDERIGYFIGAKVDDNKRFGYTTAMKSENDKAVTIATNIGTAAWLAAIGRKRPISFFVNNSAVPVTDPRIGIVQLAEGYTNFAGSGRPMNALARTAVLVHEARHSDCTGGLKERDVLNLTIGQPPENRSCGHLHTICTAGDYANLPACDGREWGAYAMGWLYANEFAKSCENCTEAMLQTAAVVAIDSLQRIEKSTQIAMRQGTLPPPDLSSDPRVR
jgi:hypothetical protein